MVPDSVRQYRDERALTILEASDRQRQQLIESGRQTKNAVVESASVLTEVGEEVARLLALSDRALSSILDVLATSSARLAGMEQMMAHPDETKAAEYHRRGCFALSSGWFPEAIKAFKRAIKLYPYSSWTWFELGISHQKSGDVAGAIRAFQFCARYGVSSSPEVAATAILLEASAHRVEGNYELSRSALSKYDQDFRNCAEIHLASGLHHGDSAALGRALTLAPSMVIDARIAQGDGLVSEQEIENAATMAGKDDISSVQRLRKVEGILSEIRELARIADLPIAQSTEDNTAATLLPSDTVLYAAGALPNTLARTERLVARLVEESRRRSDASQIAASDAARIRAAHQLALARPLDFNERAEKVIDKVAAAISGLQEAISAVGADVTEDEVMRGINSPAERLSRIASAHEVMLSELGSEASRIYQSEESLRLAQNAHAALMKSLAERRKAWARLAYGGADTWAAEWWSALRAHGLNRAFMPEVLVGELKPWQGGGQSGQLESTHELGRPETHDDEPSAESWEVPRSMKSISTMARKRAREKLEEARASRRSSAPDAEPGDSSASYQTNELDKQIKELMTEDYPRTWTSLGKRKLLAERAARIQQLQAQRESIARRSQEAALRLSRAIERNMVKDEVVFRRTILGIWTEAAEEVASQVEKSRRRLDAAELELREALDRQEQLRRKEALLAHAEMSARQAAGAWQEVVDLISSSISGDGQPLLDCLTECRDQLVANPQRSMSWRDYLRTRLLTLYSESQARQANWAKETMVAAETAASDAAELARLSAQILPRIGELLDTARHAAVEPTRLIPHTV